MRIYWWQGGLHLHPESEEDREALNNLCEAFPALAAGRLERLMGRDIVESRDEQTIVAVHEPQEVS